MAGLGHPACILALDSWVSIVCKFIIEKREAVLDGLRHLWLQRSHKDGSIFWHILAAFDLRISIGRVCIQSRPIKVRAPIL